MNRPTMMAMTGECPQLCRHHWHSHPQHHQWQQRTMHHHPNLNVDDIHQHHPAMTTMRPPPTASSDNNDQPTTPSHQQRQRHAQHPSGNNDTMPTTSSCQLQWRQCRWTQPQPLPPTAVSDNDNDQPQPRTIDDPSLVQWHHHHHQPSAMTTTTTPMPSPSSNDDMATTNSYQHPQLHMMVKIITPPSVWLINANPPSEFISFSLIFFLYNCSATTTTTMTSDIPPAYQCQLAQHINSFSLCTPSSSIVMTMIGPLSPSPSGSMPTRPASPQCHPMIASGPSPPALWVAQQ